MIVIYNIYTLVGIRSLEAICRVGTYMNEHANESNIKNIHIIYNSFAYKNENIFNKERLETVRVRKICNDKTLE